MKLKGLKLKVLQTKFSNNSSSAKKSKSTVKLLVREAELNRKQMLEKKLKWKLHLT